MLETCPTTLKEANAFVEKVHRHHKKARGHRWSIGAEANGQLVGVAIVSRPVSRKTSQYTVADVVRLATNGHRNACSFLYAKVTQICRLMGFVKVQTFILISEPGESLKALREMGWVEAGISEGGDWNVPSRGGRRTDQPQEPKMRWECVFKFCKLKVQGQPCVREIGHSGKCRIKGEVKRITTQPQESE